VDGDDHKSISEQLLQTSEQLTSAIQRAVDAGVAAEDIADTLGLSVEDVMRRISRL
jgi:DNA-directed RNA polymerase specialized sigma24 family protein